MQIIVHVQITRVTSICYSYYPGEYYLNVSKHKSTKVRHAFVLKKKFKLNVFFLIYMFLMLNRCL